MAKASSKRIGPAHQGKGAGVGAQTDLDKDALEENMALSNRDKSRHSRERGADSRRTESDQMQDQSADRLSEPPERGNEQAEE